MLINIDGVNNPLVKEAIDKIQSCERGSWIPAQAFDDGASGGGKSMTPSEDAEYLVYKDCAVFAFYTTYLTSIPPTPLQGSNEDSIICIRGLSPLNHWFGNDSNH